MLSPFVTLTLHALLWLSITSSLQLFRVDAFALRSSSPPAITAIGKRSAGTSSSAPTKTVAVTMSKESSATPPSNNDDTVVGQMLGGLVFLKTTNRQSMVEFYTQRIGMSRYLEQPNITILNHGNMILGFHQIITSEKEEEEKEKDQTRPDVQGMYTFVYPSKEQVDDMYRKLEDVADGKPRHNERYQIYQFFAKDPEGRNLEFQAFLHPLAEVSSKVTTV